MKYRCLIFALKVLIILVILSFAKSEKEEIDIEARFNIISIVEENNKFIIKHIEDTFLSVDVKKFRVFKT